MACKLSNVCASRGSKTVLFDINLNVAPNAFYGILGQNGSGKTTLIDILCGLLKPDSGTITIADKPASSYSRRELAQKISLVPQDYGISFPFTVKEIVMMGRHPHMDRFSTPQAQDLDKVNMAMTETDTLGFANRFITDLSGGERQRVVFARALAQDAPFMLLDEPTASLDVRHALRLMSGVDERVSKKGCTAMVVLQDVNLAARYCKNLIFLKHGRIIAHGPAEDVLVPDVLKDVFDIDAQVRFEPELGVLQVIFK